MQILGGGGGGGGGGDIPFPPPLYDTLQYLYYLKVTL